MERGRERVVHFVAVERWFSHGETVSSPSRSVVDRLTPFIFFASKFALCRMVPR